MNRISIIRQIRQQSSNSVYRTPHRGIVHPLVFHVQLSQSNCGAQYNTWGFECSRRSNPLTWPTLICWLRARHRSIFFPPWLTINDSLQQYRRTRWKNPGDHCPLNVYLTAKLRYQCLGWCFLALLSSYFSRSLSASCCPDISWCHAQFYR